MKKFKYLIPKTLDEAVSLHQSHGGSAMYVAGGTDVIVKITSGKLAPDYLISLKHIGVGSQLGVNRETGALHIGGLVTHRALETSSLIRLQYPIIHDAVQRIGSTQIRNRGPGKFIEISTACGPQDDFVEYGRPQDRRGESLGSHLGHRDRRAPCKIRGGVEW